jgi:hypothetical protein
VLYGNQRVSAAQLSAQVANLNTSYQALKARLQPQYGSAQMPAIVLTWELRFAILEQAQREFLPPGLHVTPAQTAQALACVRAQFSQRGETLTEAAVASGLPPDMVNPALGRWLAIQGQLLGVPVCGSSRPVTLTQERRLANQECLAAKSLSIMVNPQYGAFDYGPAGVPNQASVVLVPSTLAAAPGGPLAGNPGSSKPHLTPPC